MKIYRSVAFLILLGASLWGQAESNSAPAPPTSPAALQTGAPNRPMPPVDPMAVRIQPNRQLAIQLEQMRLKLEELKKNDASVKDPAVRKHLQLDSELWDLMFSQMNEVSLALLQIRTRASSSSPAAQMYRRQMMQERMGGNPAALPVPAPSAPAQPTAPSQAPAPNHP